MARAASSQGSVPREAPEGNPRLALLVLGPMMSPKKAVSGSSLGSVPWEGSEGTPGLALSWSLCPRKANKRKRKPRQGQQAVQGGSGLISTFGEIEEHRGDQEKDHGRTKKKD